MSAITYARLKQNLSQRNLAKSAKLSFRTVQLMDGGEHNWSISSMRKMADALNLPASGLDLLVDRFLRLHPDSVRATSMRIVQEDFDRWDLYFPQSIYAYREQHILEVIDEPPVLELDRRLRCLYASAVEAMCEEADRPAPEWCAGIGVLEKGWYFRKSGYFREITIKESPAPFRKRNIFVFADFLSHPHMRRH